jgi:outer membrane lipoprotein-sorting protein
MKFTKFAALTLAAGLLASALPVMAQPVPAPTADSIMQRIEARDATLQSFQTRVHVNVHMLSFPWFSPQLDGTSYFKRPDNYMVHFDRVPSYAHGITKLFGDIGDPAAWQKDSNISFDGLQSIDGKPMLVLRMTKKIYSDQIKDTLAYVDPATYQVTKMVWNYTNGGSISMTQNFRPQGRYSVIATQHADIKIPHVHAVADATYGTYQMNVAIADSVFKQK